MADLSCIPLAFKLFSVHFSHVLGSPSVVHSRNSSIVMVGPGLWGGKNLIFFAFNGLLVCSNSLKSLIPVRSSHFSPFPVKLVQNYSIFVAICVNGMCVCLAIVFVQLKSIFLFSFQLFQFPVGRVKLG